MLLHARGRGGVLKEHLARWADREQKALVLLEQDALGGDLGLRPGDDELACRDRDADDLGVELEVRAPGLPDAEANAATQVPIEPLVGRGLQRGGERGHVQLKLAMSLVCCRCRRRGCIFLGYVAFH